MVYDVVIGGDKDTSNTEDSMTDENSEIPTTPPYGTVTYSR